VLLIGKENGGERSQGAATPPNAIVRRTREEVSRRLLVLPASMSCKFQGCSAVIVPSSSYAGENNRLGPTSTVLDLGHGLFAELRSANGNGCASGVGWTYGSRRRG
jgi:hypothetical protein